MIGATYDGGRAACKRLWPLVLFLFLPACMPDAATQPDRRQMSLPEQAECEARGGIISIGGIIGAQFCAERLPDAGRSCSRASDCTGRCEAETRTCQTYGNPFGCHSFLDENGDVQTICVD